MILFFLIIFSISNALIVFNHEPQVIEIGQDLNLICTFLDLKIINIVNDNTRQWFQNKTSLFIFDNFNIYPADKNKEISRFKPNFIKNKMILTIKNVTENDLLSSYTCSFNFTKSKFLILTSFTQIINMPKKEEIFVKYKHNKDMNLVIINFKKIFPLPICFLKIGDSFGNFVKEFFNKTNNFSYKTQLKINYIKQNKCNNKITITCNLIDKQFNIDTKEILECKFNFIILIIFSILFIIIILLIIIIIILYKKNKRKNNIKRMRLIEENFLKNDFL